MRRSINAVVTGVVGALLLSGSALAAIPDGAGSSAEGGAAGGTEWNSNVKNLEYSNGKFKGKVTSTFALAEHHTTDSEIAICVENRTVNLTRTFVKKTKSGKKTVVADIGSGTTNANGVFAIPADKKSGTYKVALLKTEVAYFDYYGDAGEDMVAICMPDKGSY